MGRDRDTVEIHEIIRFRLLPEPEVKVEAKVEVESSDPKFTKMDDWPDEYCRV